MKNPKKLKRIDKDFLENKGYDPRIHLVVKSTSDMYEFYNIVTKVSFEMWK